MEKITVNKDNAAAQLAEWLLLKAKVKEAAEVEMSLRKALFKYFIPKPKEGVNNAEFLGLVVKGTHKLNYKLVPETLDVYMAELLKDEPEDSPLRQNGVLIDYAPYIIMNTYRSLTPEKRKIFEQTMEITDASPSLEIVAAKGLTVEEVLAAHLTPSETSGKKSKLHKLPK